MGLRFALPPWSKKEKMPEPGDLAAYRIQRLAARAGGKAPSQKMLAVIWSAVETISEANVRVRFEAELVAMYQSESLELEEAQIEVKRLKDGIVPFPAVAQLQAGDPMSKEEIDDQIATLERRRDAVVSANGSRENAVVDRPPYAAQGTVPAQH